MALLGTYVGIIPVALGMLFLPFVRRARSSWVRAFMALTVGLLGFLALDGYLEGVELAGDSSSAFGGALLVYLGAGLSYLSLVGLESYLAARDRGSGQPGGFRLSLMIALGIGLHNLGEGLAIGSAYSVGALALGAFLVIGFAIHNTTEGFAIVAPLARAGPTSLARLALLGLLAGAPAIAGAIIGAAVTNRELSAFLIGVGVGAIAQVIVQVLPSIRNGEGQALHPGAVGGVLAGVAFMYVTGLLVSV
jgi:zinc transporter, ZIP family